MLKCDVKEIQKHFNSIEKMSRSYGGKRRAKGAAIGFGFTMLREGMGFETHITPSIKGTAGLIRPTFCATAPGSKNKCDIVGTYFINSGKDWEPKYHTAVPPAKIDQIATLMEQTGAKVGVIAGQIDSTSGRSYSYYEDPEMFRIYTKPPKQGASTPAFMLSMNPITDVDARYLCNLAGAKK